MKVLFVIGKQLVSITLFHVDMVALCINVHHVVLNMVVQLIR